MFVCLCYNLLFTFKNYDMKRQFLSRGSDGGRLLLKLSFCAFLFIGCKKEQSIVSEPLPITSQGLSSAVSDSTMRVWLGRDTIDFDRVTINYFIDGVHQQASVPVEGMFPVYTLTKHTADSSAVIDIRTFTSEEKYMQYGDANSLKFREMKQFADTMYNYALRHNLIALVESGEALPSTYYQFESQQAQTFFGQIGSYWLKVWDDVVPYGSSAYAMSPLLPTLDPWISGFDNWNDRIGSYRRGGVYSVEHLYDRTFFRKHLATLSGWGTSEVWMFQGSIFSYLNNRISSMKIY